MRAATRGAGAPPGKPSGPWARAGARVRPALRWLRAVAVRPRGAALVAGTLALLAYLVGPPGGDAAAHLYQTDVWADHGWRLWDNFWYSGRYSQVNYSLLYYPLAAALGTAATVFASVAGCVGAFAAILRRQWPALASGPTIGFCLVAPLAVIAGTYPFLLGLALALATLAAVQRGRYGVAVLTGLLTTLAHPLAYVFLLAMLVGVAASIARWWRRPGAVWLTVGLAAVAGAQFVLLRAFASDDARYPFDWKDAVAIAGFCAAGVVLTRGLPDQRPLRVLFVAYGALAAGAWLISSPIGGNVVRLLLVMGLPLLLVPLAASRFRPRGLAALALTGTLFWQALPAVAGWTSSSAARAPQPEFWYPVEAFLERHHDPNHRVEVVATSDNWEAYYLAKRDVPLARGWFRQDDWPANAVLYEPLTLQGYEAWLRRTAVRYVLLPDDPLDYSAVNEAERLRAGAGLDVVARVGGWTVYELPDPTPIATPARSARVLGLTADGIVLRVAEAGRYRLRVRYTPYWSVTPPPGGAACVSPREPWGTELEVSRPGVVRIDFDVRVGTLVRAVLGDDGGCQAVEEAGARQVRVS